MPREETIQKQDNIEEKKSGLNNRANDWFSKFQRIPASEKIFFAQHLALMIKTGLPLTKGLQALAKQTRNIRFQKIIFNISSDINKGGTLADGLRKYPSIFNNLFVNIIAAGEASGTLEKSLKYLYSQLKKEHQLTSKIKGAMLYPMVIFISMSVIGAGVMVYVVPKFITIFQDVQIELPIMTRLLIKFNNFILTHGLMVLIISLIAAAVFIRIIKTKAGKKYFDSFLLKMPIISVIIKKINLARFSRTMSTLLNTDIKIVESFKITSSTINNVLYKNSLAEAAEKIKKGNPIYKTLENYPDLYNSVIIQMIAVGEESGELDTILEEISKFYQEEVEETMNALPSIIEPLIIIILAVAIGSMAVAIVMPMYALTNAF
ncbi:MAG: type II secretion system F family protein [Patescibacteria group bacterium]|jgi:type IV pilus assembly protein PilC